MKIYNSNAVARWLDITERRVRQLRDEGVITEYKHGYYDLKKVVIQYIHYLRGTNGGKNLNYSTERAKLVKAKRELQELELAEKRNDLHSAEDVKLVMTDMLINFKSRMMAIPAKASPTLSKETDQTKIYKNLKKLIDEALEELADYGHTFEEYDENEDSQPD